MGLEDVKKEIIDQAKRESSELISKAKVEAKDILQNANKEVKEYGEEASANTKKLLDSLERKMLASARADAQRTVHQVKEEMIAKVLEEAKIELNKLPESKREEFLSSLLSKAKQEIEDDTILVNENDKSLLPEISEGITVKQVEISGGLIAQTEDGKISVDLSVEEQLEMVRSEKLVEISQTLFGKD